MIFFLGEPDANALEKGKEHLNIAFKLDPNNSDLYAKYGLYYKLIGDEANSKKNLKKALQINPNNEEVRALLTE
jgi:Tfp pilus assembly protein PilF